jgi:hypothetical protein
MNDLKMPAPRSLGALANTDQQAAGTENQFAITPQGSALQAVEQSRAVAEVFASISMAKKFPRDERRAVDKILQACTRQALAEGALYAYAKGGNEISGPSIRLAETLACQWGNIEFGWREIGRGYGQDQVPFSEIEAFCWDLENIVRRSLKFVVKHWRDTKGGGYLIRDEREIYELCANMAARRMRACILNVIPRDVSDAAVEQIETTLATKFEITPDFLLKTVETFAKFGVTKKMLETRMQRNLEAMTPALFQQLVKIKNSLRDGMSDVSDWFESDKQTEPETSGAVAALKKRVGPSAPETSKNASAQSASDQQPPLADVPY